MTDKISPKVSQISSSPLYGAPEYRNCLSFSKDGNDCSMKFVTARSITREHPPDRLTIANFQTFLGNLDLPPKQFMNNLEKLSSRSKFSVNDDFVLIESLY